MQTATMTTRPAVLTDASGTFAERWTTFVQRFRADRERQRRFRKTVEELDACSDRDLNDLGIARCDIPRLAREAVYGT